MSWLYVPGSEASSEACPGPDLWVWSSGTASLRPPSWQGWRTRPWRQLLSGTTLPPSTADRGVARWTASLRASRASRSASQAPASGPATSATSGPRSFGSFARWDPASSSWKTCQVSSLFPTEPSFDACSEIFPTSGSMRSGTCSERQTWAHRTVGRGSSFSRGEYPTPSATPYGSSQNEGQVPHDRPTRGTPSLESWARKVGADPMWKSPTSREWKGVTGPSRHGAQLADQADRWTTPTASDSVGSTGGTTVNGGGRTLRNDARQWPTPTAGDSKAGGSRNTNTKAHLGVSLSDAVATGDSRGRRDRATPKDGPAGSPTAGPLPQLSPAFVEVMMGFPPGWSDPGDPTA
jgi:hypothetical protein